MIGDDVDFEDYYNGGTGITTINGAWDTVKIRASSTTAAGFGAFYDTVAGLTVCGATVVPEPSTIGLLSLTAFALGGRRKRLKLQY